VRIIARLSDNLNHAPAPTYRKTNKLFAIETKIPLSKSFRLLAAGGYVFTSQQDGNADVLPTSSGVQDNYIIFKFSLRYLIKNKGFIETTFGSYDVFNPYTLNTPFTQLTGEVELSHKYVLYSYFRYQYDNDIFRPDNYFMSAGLKIRIEKK
jgi:cold shock CspA family protein